MTVNAYNILIIIYAKSPREGEDMGKHKKSKYAIGDTVVITVYGTIGKITDIKWMDQLCVYEINNSESLYLESTLQLLSEYDGKVIEHEQIDIEYKYLIGDLVQVRSYGADLFKIVGFRTELWNYMDNSWQDIIYELSRISDGGWLEVGEEEITLVAEAEQASTYIQKLGFLYMMNRPKDKKEKILNSFRKAEREELIRKRQEKELIDQLLDLYNDYRMLFGWFSDEEYKQVMKVILLKLKNMNKMDRKNSQRI